MNLPKDAVLLKVFIGEAARYDGRPAYEAIVLKARDMSMAGATVLRGPLSFGKRSQLHSEKILRLSNDLPIVIEMVDSQEQIDKFLPILASMIGSGLVTIQKVQAIEYSDEKAT
jgi:PII-like signaling protein